MATETVITDEVRSFIGRAADPVVQEVDATGIRAYVSAGCSSSRR